MSAILQSLRANKQVLHAPAGNLRKCHSAWNPTRYARSQARRRGVRSSRLTVQAVLAVDKEGPGTDVQAQRAVGGLDIDQALESESAATEGVSASPAPWSVIRSSPAGGGVVDVICWEGTRNIRVWLPPGYSVLDQAPLPVLYLNDGQNLFDTRESLSGSCWQVGETASKLILSGRLPPFAVVGVDHSGATRSYDYLPYKPGSGPKNYRHDAESWPGGGIEQYMERFWKEVVPFVTQKYKLSQDPKYVGFGGSSFGGICTLYAAMHYPDRIGAVLVESPSLWFADEKFLKQDIAEYSGSWPERVFAAMGTKEYSGIRKDDQPEFDSILAEYVPLLGQMLEKKGVTKDSGRLRLQVEGGASHTESAWAGRLGGALEFLLSPWWEGALAGRGLYFTVPLRLKAGLPAVCFFNKAESATLKHSDTLKMNLGFNMNWEAGSTQVPMHACSWLPSAGGADWWRATFEVPAAAYEMHFAFSDGQDTWDNNNGANHYRRVRLFGEDNASAAVIDLIQHATAASTAPADEAAGRNRGSLFFTMPEKLVAGAPAMLYVNRKRSWAVADQPNVKAHVGFNDWTSSVQTLDLKPTCLWRAEGIDWWGVSMVVPEGALSMELCLTDGVDNWDTNDGHNYSAPVQNVSPQVASRGVAKVDSMEHGAGRMDILTLSKRQVKDEAAKRSKWTEEKTLRVWLPPGYDKDNAPPGGWPVLYFNDGQNIFEDWLAHQGVSWRIGYTASDLITSGRLPPFVIVGVDSAGPMRSLNYLPYAPGTGVGGFRGDCERWPGGGVDSFLHRLVDEVMPMLQERYHLSCDPARVAFGGGSFAGICALYAGMKYPHVFGAVLAESPSLWVTEGRFLGDMADHHGPLPERVFIGCGTKEYSATRDHVRADVDELLLHYYCEAARILEEKGMRPGQGRLKFLVEQDAGHHELAWQWRLTGALEYLLQPWRD